MQIPTQGTFVPAGSRDQDSHRDSWITTFGLLLEAHAALVRLFDRRLQRECGLPLIHLEVLLRLGRSPGACMPAGELSRSIALTTGATTRRIDRMVDAGLIRRRASDSDGRVVELTLTEDGEAALAAALPVHTEDLDRHMASVLGPDGLSTLDSQLRLLRDQFDTGATW